MRGVGDLMVVKAVLLHPEEGVEGVRESGVAVRAAASLGQPARSYSTRRFRDTGNKVTRDHPGNVRCPGCKKVPGGLLDRTHAEQGTQGGRAGYREEEKKSRHEDH